MTPGNAVLDAFINANILIVVAFGLWSVVRFCLRHAGLKHSYSIQLKLLNAVFLAIVISPFLVLLFNQAQSLGFVSSANVNFSDLIVSYFLNGGFEMKATEFERLLTVRDTFTTDVMNSAGMLAWIAIAAFLSGLIIGTGRLAYSIFCLHRIVSSSHRLRRFGRVQIRVSDMTLVPFSTRGLRDYLIVIPSHMVGRSEELRVSLAHEFQHLRQGDIEWEMALEALKPFFFLNPAYHAWKRRVEDLRELSCDSEVLARGRIDVRAYCDTLLSVCQHSLRRDRNFVIAVPKVTLVTADRSAIKEGGTSFLEERIISLLERQVLRRQKLMSLIIGCTLVGLIAFTAIAIQSPKDWSQDRLMLSTVVNLERLDEINRVSSFGRIRN